ncbi:hypothetical protein ABT299_15125 [Spirillospora sp. NPDC000708]|jgi:hypothetical protein|uniref:hypothetical protein n=1 Tax=Actinomadura TaxID=1988 RepID=UPI00168510FF|nr:hypothetical protein [Actinomadura sp. RB99]MBD2896137.1 hypothetical protein [Actinomadura sp. RB99]
MFWRKQRAAIEGFHPLHRTLVLEKGFSVSLPRDQWEPVIRSLAGHEAAVKRRKWRVTPRTSRVLVPMLRVLAADMPPEGLLSVALDMRGADVPEKRGPERPVQVSRPILSMKEWFVVDPWLRMRAELRDGSVVELAVTDRVRHRKYKKRNPRGKVKYKHKTKTVQMVSVTRRLGKGAAPRPPGTPPPRWIQVRVKDGNRFMIRANAKLLGPLKDDELRERILHVSTEPFRWTPAGAAGAAGRSAR